MKQIRLLLIAFSLLLLNISPMDGAVPRGDKREFRGAWIHIINSQFQGKTPNEIKQLLVKQLDALKEANINAVIFQVRAEGDAFYKSNLEPWSRYLTGVQGVAPSEDFDPLQFMIDETHRRGMELHAWINPYRAAINIDKPVAKEHYYAKYPVRFIKYGNQLFFDPSLPVNRQHICNVVKDIVMRYDVDAIHMDDYFYPYPKEDLAFDDNASFNRFGGGYTDKDDWRRDNVNLLIRDIHKTIRDAKPWVKFGVSPFGIYRNELSDPYGSRTYGLQNYDDLYADVLLWVNKGWVDYNIPQIYWHVGHPLADYAVLVDWWAKNSSNRPLFIGQSIPNTIQNGDVNDPMKNQLPLKMKIQRSYQSVGGSCQWPATSLVFNEGRYKEALANYYHKEIALAPVFKFMDSTPPKKVRKVKKIWTADGYILFWSEPKAKKELDRAARYVIYRFERGEKVNLEDPSHIVALTGENFYKMPYDQGKKKYTYIITALDRLQNESKGKKVKVKL